MSMVLGGEFVPPGDVDHPSWAVDVHTMSYAELVNVHDPSLKDTESWESNLIN